MKDEKNAVAEESKMKDKKVIQTSAWGIQK